MPTVFSNSSVPVYELRFHWPAGERGVSGRDVAGEAQDVADRQLGRRDDVRGRRVDDHDARGGRGLDVDVVEADAGAGDDLQRGRRRDRLGVDLRRRADEHRVRVGERGQQCRAVGAVDAADVEVGPEGVDRGGREFFGDEDDGLRHEADPLERCASARAERVDAAPHAVGGEACASLPPARAARPTV